MKTDNFKCTHCKKMVASNNSTKGTVSSEARGLNMGTVPSEARGLSPITIGTKNRNHCPFCLYSLHVDDKIAGDRKSKCRGEMQPIGLTFKKEGTDKYGKERQGEIMLVHECNKCGKININRLAGDDEPKKIMKIFQNSKNNKSLFSKLKTCNIVLLDEDNQAKIKEQLYGPESASK